MNNRGIVGLLTIMIAVVILILITALAGPLTYNTNIARNSSNESLSQFGLGCVLANGTINGTMDNYQQANCIASDLLVPAFVFTVIGVAGAVILAKVVL